MANWLSEKIRPVTHRDIAVAGQMLLGAATIITPPTPGTSYAYLQASGFPPPLVGLALFASAVIMGITSSKAIYFICCFTMMIFSLVSAIGFFSGHVSLQAVSLYATLFAHAVRSYPERH